MTSNKYLLKNGASTFEIGQDALKSADIEKIGYNSFHIIKNNQSYTVNIHDIDLKERKVLLKLNDRFLEFTIDPPLHQMIQSLGLAANKKKKDDMVIAPMPGLVLKILVQEQEEVRKGDSLIVLEAMKMENILKAAHDGVIREIKVKQGDKVEKAQALILF